MDINRFEVWFDQIYPNFGFQDSVRNNVKDYARQAWDAALLAQANPKPVNGNARMIGFGSPATVVAPDKRPKLPEPTDADAITIKHWNIWDTAKNRFAQTGLDKQSAFYWAQRYNTKEKCNIYIPVPVPHE
ncbi:hypothetical protein D3C76_429770 [compost metagenome]